MVTVILIVLMIASIITIGWIIADQIYPIPPPMSVGKTWRLLRKKRTTLHDEDVYEPVDFPND